MFTNFKSLARTAWIPILMLSAPINASDSDNLVGFAQRCGVKAVLASARVFSDNDKNRWKEYADPKQVPDNGEWSETAYVWASPGSPVVIDVEGVGQDFSDSTYDCFDSSHKLSSLEHEFRTAWGWEFTEERQFDRDGKEITKSHFFSTKDRTEIPHPQDADTVAEAMTAKVYNRLSDAPFFPLLALSKKVE